MNIIKISQDSLTEELSYRALVGDNSITKLNIYNGTSISNVYLNISNQGIQSTLESLQDWTKAVNNEISNQLYKISNLYNPQSNICNAWFNSFSLNEALQTRTITYTYNEPDEINNQPCHNTIDDCLSLSLAPQIKHTGQLKISDKLYNLLNSLTLIIPYDKDIPSNEQDHIIYEDIMYDIMIDSSISYNKDIHLFLIVKPHKSKINIIHKIEVYPPNRDTKYSLQAATDGIVIADDQSNIIDKMKNSKFIAMKDNIKIVRRQPISTWGIITTAMEYRDNLVRQADNIEEIKPFGLNIINQTGNNIKNLDNSDDYIRTFQNIQCLQCDYHNLMFTSDYFFDIGTGYQVIPDWSLVGKLGEPGKKSRRRFLLLHERPIKGMEYDDQGEYKQAGHKQETDDSIRDIWVYYESPSQRQKTKSVAGFDEDTVLEYVDNATTSDNLDEALNDIEEKINHNKIKSLYLLSKQQTIDEKKETLEKHNIKIEA